MFVKTEDSTHDLLCVLVVCIHQTSKNETSENVGININELARSFSMSYPDTLKLETLHFTRYEISYKFNRCVLPAPPTASASASKLTKI